MIMKLALGLYPLAPRKWVSARIASWARRLLWLAAPPLVLRQTTAAQLSGTTGGGGGLGGSTPPPPNVTGELGACVPPPPQLMVPTGTPAQYRCCELFHAVAVLPTYLKKSVM